MSDSYPLTFLSVESEILKLTPYPSLSLCSDR